MLGNLSHCIHYFSIHISGDSVNMRRNKDKNRVTMAKVDETTTLFDMFVAPPERVELIPAGGPPAEHSSIRRQLTGKL